MQTIMEHFDAKRPLIPIQSGHRFRFNPATDSDAKQPVDLGCDRVRWVILFGGTIRRNEHGDAGPWSNSKSSL
jgi:hypothetical protein